MNFHTYSGHPGIHPSALIDPGAELGEGVTVGPGSTIGPGVKIDSGTIIRSYVIISSNTQIGKNNDIYPFSVIGEDPSDKKYAGEETFPNNVGLTGHAEISNWVLMGGYAGVNPFLKIGSHAMIGGMTHITNDVPAYMIVSGTPPRTRSINSIGLQRRGFSEESIKSIREAYKIIYKRGLRIQEALEQLSTLRNDCKELDVLIESIESSEKGIHR